MGWMTDSVLGPDRIGESIVSGAPSLHHHQQPCFYGPTGESVSGRRLCTADSDRDTLGEAQRPQPWRWRRICRDGRTDGRNEQSQGKIREAAAAVIHIHTRTYTLTHTTRTQVNREQRTPWPGAHGLPMAAGLQYSILPIISSATLVQTRGCVQPS
ncbi:hypothetical protein XA68_13820 [Ophiocordyceps unilateralis]|uniref:Uncharacterized protein n=1 Tax=Ophiocordyceps unilateralis TaxID=268505 RepID=A0A2A9PMV3_OPHUN|nr:hypothetical protein XA68_13820 [Ophiocordyceps unilateralis]